MNAATPYTTLTSSLDQYLRELDKSPLTIVAYRTDNQQFLAWLTEYDATITRAQQVKRSHVNEYLKYLANNGRAGTTRSRMLSSDFFLQATMEFFQRYTDNFLKKVLKSQRNFFRSYNGF